MSSAERISFLQEKLQEVRKYYLTLKSEVASIDRRRKRLKKKEREGEETPPPHAVTFAARPKDLTAALLSSSLQHNGFHVIGVFGHRHESILGLARTEHCCRRVQVMTRPPWRRPILQPDSAQPP